MEDKFGGNRSVINGTSFLGRDVQTQMLESNGEATEHWSRIENCNCPFVMEERKIPLGIDEIGAILADAPFSVHASGKVSSLAEQLAQFPRAMVEDVKILAARFSMLTGKELLRVRIEGVTTNACKKVHADYTDVRLITTYAGPGTEYSPHGDANCCLARMPTGAVGLFKGSLFGEGHEPCLHRSPPIEGTDAKRLVLVIDTPRRETN